MGPGEGALPLITFVTRILTRRLRIPEAPRCFVRRTNAPASAVKVERAFPWCAAVLAVCVAASSARADEAIELRWLRCTLDGGLASRTFDCNVDLADQPMVVAISVAAPVDSVLGFVADIAMQTSSPTLPDWWQFQPGGCRDGLATADVAFDSGSNCGDPFSGAGVAVFQSLTPGEPRGLPSQARMLASVAVPSPQPGMLEPGTVYNVCRVVVHGGGTVSPPSCAGCLEPVCLVLNEVRVLYRSQGVVQTSRLTLPSAGNANWIGWQSTPGTPCLTVPTRRSSWGALKSLYR